MLKKKAEEISFIIFISKKFNLSKRTSIGSHSRAGCLWMQKIKGQWIQRFLSLILSVGNYVVRNNKHEMAEKLRDSIKIMCKLI